MPTGNNDPNAPTHFDPADFGREQAIFFAAVEAADAVQRQAVLDQHCAGNADLRKRVEALLAAHDGRDSLPPVPVPVPEAIGTLIGGRYKLLERIGEGGFGIVYVAEQTSPIKRRVAVKIIKAGMDTRAVVARFEAERQALAMMDHPNIARVFDAGATDTGRPYFVMELVRGIPSRRSAIKTNSPPASGSSCSCRSARPCSTRTRRGSSIATSNRTTCWSHCTMACPSPR